LVSLTAATIKVILNLTDTDISDTNFEPIVDVAVDLLNLYGADISNMSGTAGTKTIGVDSKQKGALILVTREVWYGIHQGPEEVNVGNITVTLGNILGNPTTMKNIKDVARQLKEIEVDTG